MLCNIFLFVFSVNTTIEDSDFIVSQDQANEYFQNASDGGEVQEMPSSIDKWHFLSLK